MRKLASIQQIAEIKPIEGADVIEAVRANGWWVVTKKNEYSVGELAVYNEVDSFIPNSLCPFLTKEGHEPKSYKGVIGERLRTIRLRKQLSQGLLLPLSVLPSTVNKEVGEDVTEVLGIVKWEPPEEFTSADSKGLFPHWIPKTDQERIQNIYRSMVPILESKSFYLEEKIEGQSHTSYIMDGIFGVCSRNLELKDSDNTFWNTAKKYELPDRLAELGRNVAIQCEQVGPGISGNIYGFTEYKLFVFDIFDIDEQRYLSTIERNSLATNLGMDIPPFIGSSHPSEISLDEILANADGKSKIGTTGTLREGVIWRVEDSIERLTFKSISNKYLLGQK